MGSSTRSAAGALAGDPPGGDGAAVLDFRPGRAGGAGDDDPDPQPAAVLPAYPTTRLDLWAVRGPDLTADPEAVERATCLRYYGPHELHQAIRDADRAAPVDRDLVGRAELRVCDAGGKVWHRAKGRVAA